MTKEAGRRAFSINTRGGQQPPRPAISNIFAALQLFPFATLTCLSFVSISVISFFMQ
jgi:hypothetical protein